MTPGQFRKNIKQMILNFKNDGMNIIEIFDMPVTDVNHYLELLKAVEEPDEGLSEEFLALF